MDSPYLYKLPQGTSIFRAKTIAKEGRWYTLALEDAYTYGEMITEYSTTKELRLINIMSLTFHNDFMDRLMILYPGADYTGMDMRRLSCLISLGLFDIDSQMMAAKLMKIPFPFNDISQDPLMHLNNNYLHRRNRFSEHNMDAHFVSVLEEIYGDVYDGYISPIKWSTNIHGGYFPRELCIFKHGSTHEEKEHMRPNRSASSSIPSSGGGGNNHLKYELSPEILEQHRKFVSEHPFKPLWNPHTEDEYHSSSQMGGYHSKKRRSTRKKKHHDSAT